MNDLGCPFCALTLAGEARVLLYSSNLVVAVDDAFPSALGHVLVIPRRHVGRLADLTETEAGEIMQVARSQTLRLNEDVGADGYTVGINDGSAAGQTVPHLHAHVIPRHVGDRPDPTGGIRWVLPRTAAYWQRC